MRLREVYVKSFRSISNLRSIKEDYWRRIFLLHFITLKKNTHCYQYNIFNLMYCIKNRERKNEAIFQSGRILIRFLFKARIRIRSISTQIRRHVSKDKEKIHTKDGQKVCDKSWVKNNISYHITFSVQSCIKAVYC